MAPLENSNYLRGIDGLRAIAVLSVILYHFSERLLPGGFVGVDIFFVISGYVVSRSLAAQDRSSFRGFLLAFYARRLRRIYPALVFCLLCVCLATLMFIPESFLSKSTYKTGLSSFFGLSNFYLVRLNDGYFAPGLAYNAFTHTWSLAVEEQFYLFFPFVLFVWMRARTGSGVRGLLGNGTLPLLLLVSLLVSWYQTINATEHAYYHLPSRFWELAAGALLFQLHDRGRMIPRSPLAASAATTCGLVLIALGLTLAEPESFPFPWACLPVAGTVLAIAGVSGRGGSASAMAAPLESMPMVYIGRLSYSLYLWHWPIIVLFRWTSGLGGLLEIALAAAIIFALSAFSYQWVERPFRGPGFAEGRSDSFVVSRGVALVGLCFAVAAFGNLMRSTLSLSVVAANPRDWYTHSYASPSRDQAPDSSTLVGRRIFVLGDSHAGAYKTMLQMLREGHGVEAEVLTATGCSVADLLLPADPRCRATTEMNVSAIELRARPGDFVLLASMRMVRMSDQWEPICNADIASRRSLAASEQTRRAVLEEARSIVERLERKSLLVVMEAPKPIFRSPPFRCSDWFNRSNPVCADGFAVRRDELLSDRSHVMASLDTLRRAHPTLTVWDPFPVLCPADPCTTLHEGKSLYFDGDHISAHGNRVLYPSFVSHLQAVLQANVQ